MFLQVLDAGRLTDGQGRVVNFKNVRLSCIYARIVSLTVRS